MRIYQTILLMVMLALMATSAVAEPVLPGPNALGLYFDGEAVDNTLTLAEPATVELNLIFSNPTVDFIDGWEVAVVISAGASVTGVELPIGTTTTMNGPVDWKAEMASPMPCNAITKLAVFTVASDAMDETLFFLQSIAAPTLASDMPAVHLLDGTWIAVPISSGDPSLPCAGINSTTADEVDSWGGVKSLYR